MNQRERFLVFAVGGLMLVVGLQYAISSYRTGYQQRKTKLANLEDKLSNQKDAQMAGAVADENMRQYGMRSLPSDPQKAQAQYKEWLEELAAGTDLKKWNVDYIGDQGSNRLFRQYTFRVSGTGNIQRVSEFFTGFHKQNYLHRVKKVVLRRSGDKGDLLMDTDIQTIAMSSAERDQAPPTVIDSRTENAGDTLLTAISNRNMFSPPNQAPRYDGSSTIEAFLEQDFSSRIRFKDPDSEEGVDIEVSGDLPPGLRYSRGELIGRAREKGEYTINVVARDRGLPVREVTKELLVKVVDPPPKEEEPEGPPPFDESRLAILTGLVQSRGQWTAWINIRTRGELLKLRKGDDFEVGSVTGKVLAVDSRSVTWESEGQQFTMKQDSSLADAKSAVN